MNIRMYYFIPLSSALVGWLFNKLYGRSLLRKWIPAQKNKLAALISDQINQFVAGEAFKEKIAHPDWIEKAMPLIETKIDEFLNTRLPQEIPMFSMFVGNKTTDQVKAVFLDHLRELFPSIMNDMAGNLTRQVDIRSFIEAELDKDNFLTLIGNDLNKPLQQFSVAGLLLGLAIGLLNLLIFCFADC